MFYSFELPFTSKKWIRLTFAMRYSEVKISWSSSVPKIAEIWDIGLQKTGQCGSSDDGETLTKDSRHRRAALYTDPVSQARRRSNEGTYPIPLNDFPAA